MSRFPKRYNSYIEPFIGGGAVFFAADPQSSIIADKNLELVNAYNMLKEDVTSVISQLKDFPIDKDFFYELRALSWETLDSAIAAARTIYLNKTCFNGLYRVNRAGGFNTPWGNPQALSVIDCANLFAVSARLQNTKIIGGDYRDVLAQNANNGDLVFLDPPYLPVGPNSDFRRYTAEQFIDQDHVLLANEVKRLQDIGCFVIITNSNHPLVHQLFSDLSREVISTRRSISSDASTRRGEDVIVTAPPKMRLQVRAVKDALPEQVNKFPTTRYMGSKSKLLLDIWDVARQLEYETVLDLFAGSGVVSYMFKVQGKQVIANDYMAFSANLAKATIENSSVTLPAELAQEMIASRFVNDGFISRTFAGLYYSEEENAWLDSMRFGIQGIRNPQRRAIAMAALVRACIKRRPRGIFTYTGMRYDDGRRDLRVSIQDHFLEAVNDLNNSVFDSGKQCRVRHGDAMTVAPVANSLVYLDPPYYTALSDNEYVRRYHFVEGLVRGWKGVEIQENTSTKKFKSYPTPFSSKAGAYKAFDTLFRKHRFSDILVSYSSNSFPTMDEMISLLSKYKSQVDVIPIDYRYSFGTHSNKVDDNRNTVSEYLFVGHGCNR